MDNQNKKEYLETIKSLTLDNLRYLPHAPSVQMQTVPPDTLSFEDYGEADDLGMCYLTAFRNSLFRKNQK